MSGYEIKLIWKQTVMKASLLMQGWLEEVTCMKACQHLIS
jgi:hypothetical protein